MDLFPSWSFPGWYGPDGDAEAFGGFGTSVDPLATSDVDLGGSPIPVTEPAFGAAPSVGNPTVSSYLAQFTTPIPLRLVSQWPVSYFLRMLHDPNVVWDRKNFSPTPEDQQALHEFCIHAIWDPNGVEGYCPNPSESELKDFLEHLDPALHGRLHRYMPNLKFRFSRKSSYRKKRENEQFWCYVAKKHRGLTSLDINDYFSIALHLFENIVPDMQQLAALGLEVGVQYTPSTLHMVETHVNEIRTRLISRQLLVIDCMLSFFTVELRNDGEGLHVISLKTDMDVKGPWPPGMKLVLPS